MSFNIADFSSKIKKHGTARNTLFRVTIALPHAIREELSAISVVPDLHFLCQTVTLPEIEIGSTDIQPQGFGPMVRRPQSVSFPLLPAVFMVDENQGVLKFFHRWAQHIVNFDTSGGSFASVNNVLPFEMNYKNDYETVMTVTSFKDDGTPSYEYKFSGLYPLSIGSVEKSWADNDQLATLPIGFTYDQLKVSGTAQGTYNPSPGPNSKDALGYDPFFLSKESKSFASGKVPTSIQDTINQYSSINNDLFRGLKL